MHYKLVIRGPAHNWLHVKETILTPQELNQVYLSSNLYGTHPDITLSQLFKVTEELVKKKEFLWCRSWLDSPSLSEEEDQKNTIKKILSKVGLDSLTDEQYEDFLEGFSYYFPNCHCVESIEYISYKIISF